MKDCPSPPDQDRPRSPVGLVLVGLGSPVAIAPSVLQTATRQLAELLQCPVLSLDAGADPDAAQASLAAQALSLSCTWLAGLEADVGMPLAKGRCWAEALGAWRQPALLVIPAAQLASGLPSAATALLRQWQVPLVGLLQWGGTWQAEARRRDGLPWLGHLPELRPAQTDAEPGRDDGGGGDDGGSQLAAAVALRWRQLDRG